MIQPKTLQLHMPQVYESDAYEELYQKLSGDLDTECQCPFSSINAINAVIVHS